MGRFDYGGRIFKRKGSAETVTVYLLIDKLSEEVVGVYKYECVAMIEAKRPGIKKALTDMFNGGKSSSRYRVEVHELIE